MSSSSGPNKGQRELAGSYQGHWVTQGVTLVAKGGSSYSPGAVDADCSLSPPKTICAWLRVVTLLRRTQRIKRSKPWQTIPNPMVWVPCLRDEWQWVSLSSSAPSGIPGDLPVVFSLAKYRGFAWWTKYFPRSYGIETESNPEFKESSAIGDFSKDSTGCSSQGELWYKAIHILQGAPVRTQASAWIWIPHHRSQTTT